jgi:hypothetical protein
VDVAVRTKARLVREPEKITNQQAEVWQKLFARLLDAS